MKKKITALLLALTLLLSATALTGCGGSGESFLSKNKGKGLDAKLARATKWTGAAFLILTFVLNLL